MNRDPGPGRGRGRDLGRGRGRVRDRGRGPWRSPGGGAHWVPKGRSSDPSSHSSYSVGPDESSSGEKPFSNRDRNSQPNSRRCFPSYPNSTGNIFCQKEPLENKSLEDSMSSTGRILHDQSAPSCSSLGSNQSDCSVASNSVNKGDSALMPAISGSRDMKSDIVSAPMEKGAKDGAMHLHFSRKLNSTVPLQNQNESHLSFQEKDPNNVVSSGDSGCSEQQAVVEPCDICLPKTGTTLKLKPDCSVASNSVNKDDSPLMPAISGSRDMKSDIVSAPMEKGAKDGAMHLHFSRKLNSTVPLQNQNESHLSFQEKDPNNVVSSGDSGCSEQQAVVEPCDICLPKTGTTLKLKPDCSVASNSVNKDDSALMPAISGSRDMKSDIVSAPLEKGAKDGAMHRDFSLKLNSTVPLQNQNESHLSFQEKDPNNVVSSGDSGCSEQQAVVEPCDICLPKTGTTLKLKPDCSVASNSVNKDDSALMPAISGSRDMKSDIVSAPLEKGAKDGAMHRDFSLKLNSTVPLQNQNESHLSFQEKDPNNVVSSGDSGCSEQQAVVEPCDICLPKTGTTLKLKPDCSVASNSVNKDDSALMPAISGSRDMKSDIVSAPLEKGAKDGAMHRDFSLKLNSTVPLQNHNESHLSFQGGANDQLSQEKDPNNVVSSGDSGYSEQQAVVEPCDICLPKTGTTLKLKPDCSVASNSVNKDDSPLMPAISGSRDMNSDIVSAPLEKGAKDGAVHLDFSRKLNSTVPLQNQNESHLSFQACANDQLSQEKDPNILVSAGDSGYSEQQAEVEPFDICLPKTGTTLKLKPSLLVKNREKRNNVRRAAEGVKGPILRSGMVLLKNYLSLHDQIKIIKLCRDIGLGPGGFYQPVYRDGGRMHLKMMSLGRNWDPDRGKYVEHRPFDGAKAPIFPSYFHPLVERAIKDSRALIEKNCKSTAAEDILPSLSPNICVVNFYSESGRLGLHQDKDESPESLRRGLPVVSFSIGDIGEFLYGDQRDVEKAEKVKLESGDVLIFGGVSRHIFHGVSSVQPKTAPAALLDETNLRPGRLNLTFREY